MTKRQEFTGKVKFAAWERSGGLCETCKAMLKPGRIEYDHRVPCALGGDASLENCECICRECHAEKTAKQDVPAIARAVRQERAQAFIRKPSRWPTAKNGPLKQKIGG